MLQGIAPFYLREARLSGFDFVAKLTVSFHKKVGI